MKMSQEPKIWYFIDKPSLADLFKEARKQFPELNIPEIPTEQLEKVKVVPGYVSVTVGKK